MAQRLASLAVNVNDQRDTPNRRSSSAPTQAALSVGIIAVRPPCSCTRDWIAATTGCGECPAIAPVSPSAKSTYSCPSMSVTRLPRAPLRYSGKCPAALFIQVIGTPPKRLRCPRAYASAERG
jgi:hypothetical protein